MKAAKRLRCDQCGVHACLWVVNSRARRDSNPHDKRPRVSVRFLCNDCLLAEIGGEE